MMYIAVCLQVLILPITFILVGIFHKPSNWANFAPLGFGEIYGGQTSYDWRFAFMFFAMLGFESISMAVERNQGTTKRTSLAAIVLSLLITAVLYVLILREVLTGGHGSFKTQM